MDFRWYQREAIDAIYSYFQFNDGNPLVSAATGSGKSVMIGGFMAEVLERWPDQRFVVLAHIKELLEQNAEKLYQINPAIDFGFYSSGLRSRDLHNSVVFAGIQSIYKRAFELGHADIILVDEAHLINMESDGMYKKFLSDMKLVNPQVKVCGFTATPYRMKSGLLTEGKNAIFDQVIYETDILRLMDEGFLSRVISRPGNRVIDTSQCAIQAGEFKEADTDMAARFDGLMLAAVNEIIAIGREENRRSWLVFCPSVNYAEEVRELMREQGVACEMVSHKTSDGDRSRFLADFKSGRLQCLVNKDVLTTGIDVPGIDLIAMLRPTKSPGLYSQIVGRGLRIAPGKINCRVLDYAGNIERHGPIDSIKVGKKGPSQPGEAPVKTCDQCGEYVHAGLRQCPHCLFAFPEPDKAKHEERASAAAITSDQFEPETFDVTSWEWYRHQKPGKPDSVRVEYLCGIQVFKQWLCFDHTGRPRADAVRYFCFVTGLNYAPQSTTLALEHFNSERPAAPKSITIKPGKFPEVVSVQT